MNLFSPLLLHRIIEKKKINVKDKLIQNIICPPTPYTRSSDAWTQTTGGGKRYTGVKKIFYFSTL